MPRPGGTRGIIRDAELGAVMVFMGCFISWEVESFGGEEEEVVDDEEEGEGDVDELEGEDEDEEDVLVDVSDSESLLSQGSERWIAFRFKDGDTVGVRTD